MIAQRIIYARHHVAGRAAERIGMWIAWHLPRWIVMWCYIRIVATGTSGGWSGTVPSDLNVMECLRRWDGVDR